MSAAAVVEHPLHRLLLFGREVEVVAVVAHVEDVLHALEELVTVTFGYAEQEADGLHRQLAGHLAHEVDLAVERGQQAAGAAPQVAFEPADGLGGEALADQSTDPGMPRVVHHVEHHPGHRQVGQQGATVLAVAAAFGGVQRGVVEHLERLGIGRHRPEPLAVRCVLGRLVPVNGSDAAMLLENRVGEPGGEVVEIGQVEGEPRCGDAAHTTGPRWSRPGRR